MESNIYSIFSTALVLLLLKTTMGKVTKKIVIK